MTSILLLTKTKIPKDLWDALARHMLGSEYGEQDRKAAVLYEYETFNATEGELLLDTDIRYLEVINDLKKCGYSKDNCELNFKFLNNLQSEWKQYATMMRQNKNLLDINIVAFYNILKQNQGDVNDVMKSKKKAVVITFDPLALVAKQTKVSKRKEKVIVSFESEGSDDELKKITALLDKAFNWKKFYSKQTNNNLRTSSATSSANEKQEYVKSDDKKEEKKVDEKKKDMSKVKCYNFKKEGNFSNDCKKAKVKDYEYYKTKMFLAKKDKDEQVLLAEDHAWMESSSDSDQEINANMVFMAQIEKVLSNSEASSSSFDDKIAEYFVPAVLTQQHYPATSTCIGSNEEESSNIKEEEEEHLASTVPAPALYSFVSESDETEPFEEGETAATPPPFGYRVAARISVQPHILMPFRSESKVERLLAIPTPPLSPVSLTSYTLPPPLMPLPIL
nr:hypothetical protein [Tanacetum cinerariifolium]